MFSDAILRQTHTARKGKTKLFCHISRSKFTGFGVTDNTALPYAVLGQEFLLLTFVSFCGITCCDSASLKLCVCNAASPSSQSSSPDIVEPFGFYPYSANFVKEDFFTVALVARLHPIYPILYTA